MHNKHTDHKNFKKRENVQKGQNQTNLANQNKNEVQKLKSIVRDVQNERENRIPNV